MWFSNIINKAKGGPSRPSPSPVSSFSSDTKAEYESSKSSQTNLHSQRPTGIPGKPAAPLVFDPYFGERTYSATKGGFEVSDIEFTSDFFASDRIIEGNSVKSLKHPHSYAQQALLRPTPEPLSYQISLTSPTAYPLRESMQTWSGVPSIDRFLRFLRLILASTASEKAILIDGTQGIYIPAGLWSRPGLRVGAFSSKVTALQQITRCLTSLIDQLDSLAMAYPVPAAFFTAKPCYVVEVGEEGMGDMTGHSIHASSILTSVNSTWDLPSVPLALASWQQCCEYLARCLSALMSCYHTLQDTQQNAIFSISCIPSITAPSAMPFPRSLYLPRRLSTEEFFDDSALDEIFVKLFRSGRLAALELSLLRRAFTGAHSSLYLNAISMLALEKDTEKQTSSTSTYHPLSSSSLSSSLRQPQSQSQNQIQSQPQASHPQRLSSSSSSSSSSSQWSMAQHGSMPPQNAISSSSSTSTTTSSSMASNSSSGSIFQRFKSAAISVVQEASRLSQDVLPTKLDTIEVQQYASLLSSASVSALALQSIFLRLAHVSSSPSFISAESATVLRLSATKEELTNLRIVTAIHDAMVLPIRGFQSFAKRGEGQEHKQEQTEDSSRSHPFVLTLEDLQPLTLPMEISLGVLAYAPHGIESTTSTNTYHSQIPSSASTNAMEVLESQCVSLRAHSSFLDKSTGVQTVVNKPLLNAWRSKILPEVREVKRMGIEIRHCLNQITRLVDDIVVSIAIEDITRNSLGSLEHVSEAMLDGM